MTVVFVSRGLAYTVTDRPEPLPFGLDTLATILPIYVYGILWLFAAGLGVWLATGRRTPLAVAFMTGMPTLWGTAYLISWIASGLHSRDWITVVLYYCLSIIIVCFGVIAPRVVVVRHGSE